MPVLQPPRPQETHPQIQKEYIETGKLRYVFLDLPLEAIHKLAFKAAEAANCAGEQGKYWEMHDRLFENQKALEPSRTAHAEAVGLNVAEFEACLASGKQAEEIPPDMAEARKAGITGTPGFFLAYTDPKTSTVRTVASLKGAQPFAAFKAEIDRLLAEPANLGPRRISNFLVIDGRQARPLLGGVHGAAGSRSRPRGSRCAPSSGRSSSAPRAGCPRNRRAPRAPALRRGRADPAAGSPCNSPRRTSRRRTPRGCHPCRGRRTG